MTLPQLWLSGETAQAVRAMALMYRHIPWLNIWQSTGGD
jgi:hypothetical protein